MKIFIDGKVYDSLETPVLLVFDENESEMFDGMKRFVSAPIESMQEERQNLIELDLFKIPEKKKEAFLVDISWDGMPSATEKVFTTYRGASQYLIDEGFEPYYDKFWESVAFELINSIDEQYRGYIHSFALNE